MSDDDKERAMSAIVRVAVDQWARDELGMVAEEVAQVLQALARVVAPEPSTTEDRPDRGGAA